MPNVPRVTRPKFVIKKFPSALSPGGGTRLWSIQAMGVEDGVSAALLLTPQPGNLLKLWFVDARLFKLGKIDDDLFLLYLQNNHCCRYHWYILVIFNTY